MTRRAACIGLTFLVTLGLLGAAAPSVTAQAPVEVPLTMEREKFVPEELRIKAGSRFVLVITNTDDITHEVDIPKLRIEKKIRAGQTLKLQIPALKPGKYELVDDESTPNLNGVMIAE